MAGILLADATANLALYIEASKKVALGQSYTIGDRTLTRVDASEIRQMINFWQNWCKTLGGGGDQVRRILPRDL